MSTKKEGAFPERIRVIRYGQQSCESREILRDQSKSTLAGIRNSRKSNNPFTPQQWLSFCSLLNSLFLLMFLHLSVLAAGECQLKAELGKKAQSIGGFLFFIFLSLYPSLFASEGLPKLEVGIMGRINMRGLDMCGGRRTPVQKEARGFGGWSLAKAAGCGGRSNKRGRRGNIGREKGTRDGTRGGSRGWSVCDTRISSPPNYPLTGYTANGHPYRFYNSIYVNTHLSND